MRCYLIEIAKHSMIGELKEVWKECFMDEGSYIDFYYEKRFSNVTTLVKKVEEQIVSMLTLIPCEFVNKEQTQALYYVYAVATRNDHQKRGYAKELILYAQQLANKEGAKTFLVPASQSLFSYYERYGYQTAGRKTTLITSLCQLKKNLSYHHKKKAIQVNDLAADEFYMLREQSFGQSGYIRWDIRALSYLLEEYRFCGGTAVQVQCEEEVGALLYHYDPTAKKLYVKETTLKQETLGEVLLYMFEGFSLDRIDQIEITLSNHNIQQGMTFDFAMLSQSFGEDIGFVNLVKD